jgi:hypothetical protein
MVVKLGQRPQKIQKIELPQELLQQKYAVIRDEMLWREYTSIKTRGNSEGFRQALSVLRVLREAPE